MQRHEIAKMALMMFALVLDPAPVQAQAALPQEEAPMDHSTDPMPMEHMGHGTTPDSTQEMDHDMVYGNAPSEGADGMEHESMADESSLPDVRDPHAYADGYDFSQFPMRHEGISLKIGSLLVDRLEAVRDGNDTSAAYDLQAWYGGDFDRAVLKAEGDVDNGKLQEGRTELLWGHAVSAFWDAQLGLRYDNGADLDRGWLAFGIQGLAPYWFEVDAAGYVGKEGRTALSLGAEYELLFTQRLILQPRIEADFHGKDDAERGIDSGLSELAAGLRLRYEIRREFAPYVGLEWTGKFGGTADYAHDAGLDTKETLAVAGVRFRF